MERFVDANAVNFEGAPRFQKLASLPVSSVRIADGGEEIITCQKHGDGPTFVETRKIAVSGDAIVRRDAEDVYVIDREAFSQFYKLDANGDRYIATNRGRAVFLSEDTVIDAPWGGTQHIKAGGVLFKSDLGGDVYGNQAQSFNEDFGRIMADGTVVPLSLDISKQKEIAERTQSEDHVRDIVQRIRHRNNLSSQGT